MNDFDKIKSFWNTRPCNLNHSNKEVESKEYFDEVEAKKYKVEPHIPAFAEYEKWNGKTILEIGCGLGTEAINFARAGANYYGIDISEKSVELCKKRFSVYGLNGTVQVGNAENMKDIFPDDHKFDLIWAFGSIHHTKNPSNVINEIKRLLKPDGELRMMVYSRISYKLFWIMKETNQWDMSKINEIIPMYSEAQTGCPYTYSYTFDEVKELLQGFNVYDIRKDHIFTYSIPEYKNHVYVLEDCWKNVSDKEMRTLEQELGWHTLVKASLKL